MECEAVDEALQLLDTLHRLAEEESTRRHLVKVTDLQSLALYRKGNLTKALPKLERALQLGESDGYIRSSFLDEGIKLGELLLEYLQQRQRGTYRARDSRVEAVQRGKDWGLL